MSGIREIDVLLASMSPTLEEGEFVFCTLPSKDLSQMVTLDPKGLFVEQEGTTLIISQQNALHHGLSFSGTFRQITLTVHSSLEAVGLTAAVAKALADAGISANVVAAYYHDHIFVPSANAKAALETLHRLQQKHITGKVDTE